MKRSSRLWRSLTTPRAVDDKEARQEYITRVILVMVMASLLVLTLLIAIGWGLRAFDTEGLLRVLSMDLFVAVGLWLAQRGHWRIAGYLPPVAFLSQALYGTYNFGASSITILYFLAIMMTAMLQGIRIQRVLLPIIIGLYVAAAWFYGERQPDAIAINLLTASSSFAGIVLLQWLSTSQLERALAEARTSASKLVGANEQLETEIAERRQVEAALRESEERYRQLVNHAPAGIYELDLINARFLSVNDIMCEYTGYTRQEFLALSAFDILAGDSKKDFLARQSRVLAGEAIPETAEYRIRGKNNRDFWVILNTRLHYREGVATTATVVVHDITERRRVEHLLRVLNQASLAMEQTLTADGLFPTLGEKLKELGFACALFLTDEQQRRLFPAYLSYDATALKSAEELAGVAYQDYSIPIESAGGCQEVVSQKRAVFIQDPGEIAQLWMPASSAASGRQLTSTLGVSRVILTPLVAEEKIIGVLSLQSPVLSVNDIPAVTAFGHQVAAVWRKAQLLRDLENSLEELKQTQSQLIQAQKMEAVGRLAGGVAHDFNNLLTVIDLNVQLMARKLYHQDPLWEHVQQIQEVGERASKLTRQLLSFSRREVIEPRVINMSQAVGNLSRMLQRVLGEDIELVTILAQDLWPVKLDPSQMEQIVINLALNARDAMPQGGRLSIATKNEVVVESTSRTYSGIEPGRYVMLTVADTGLGMDEQVRTHLFEPFFTTKERGKGTGLGLPTVYGIVKQNSGHIWVESQVGRGTTFKIYIPASGDEQMAPERALPARPDGMVRGSETILVVEDEPAVRALAERILRSCGYEVLSASDGLEALRIGQNYQRPIHLLLTDVIMPSMNGKELAERLQQQQPHMRVVYMSGYGEDVIAHHGVLDEGIAFLAKPFTLDTLTTQIRAMLDAP
jgi:two-component system cell cycle sensor histidine kinase/response regulator CckA